MKQTLYFILCPSFQGSTLINVILNRHSKIAALGDTIPVKSYNAKCSCGKSVIKCAFWQEVFEKLDCKSIKHSPTYLPNQLSFSENLKINFAANFLFNRFVLLFNLSPMKVLKQHTTLFVNTYLKYLNLMKEEYQKEIIIDGEKNIEKIYLLKQSLKDINIKIIHVVRDPRGFLYSYRKRKKHSPTWLTTKRWTSKHTRIEKLRDHYKDIEYLRVRYEDFCYEPKKVLTDLLKFLKVQEEDLINKKSTQYHLLGNRMLLNFDGKIYRDTAWKKNLSKKDQTNTLHYASRLMKKYGYIS